MIPEYQTIKKLILYLFSDIFMLGMCVQKCIKTAGVLFVFTALFSGCEAMDTLLPSAGHYKVNLQINDSLPDECSFIRYNDKIYPFFEEPVSGDKDVTALMVYIRDSKGETLGRKVSYSIAPDKSNDLVITVKNLDDILPQFPIPANLSMGKYTLIFQVMSGKDILQRTERIIFYLGANNFSFNGINIHIPGISESPLLIPKDTNIMLEASLDFGSRFNPYIIWYEGKNKISEGRISDGAGVLFWMAPEQSGFFSLRAEVFPIESFKDLTGYQSEASILVSSRSKDFNLVSENISQLTHWYTFENNLSESKTAAEERALKPADNNIPLWKGINGTYGLSTGKNNAMCFPGVKIPNNALNNWLCLFRIKTLDDGVLFSVLFGSSGNVRISLSKEGHNLILSVQSPLETISQVINLPVNTDESFFTAGIKFSALPNLVSAQFNLMGVAAGNELNTKTISLRTAVENEFKIILGLASESSKNAEEETEEIPVLESTQTAVWDEFALYYMPPMESIIEKLRPTVNEN